MTMSLLTTKLYVPRVRPNLVPRPRLIERLDAGLCSGCNLILISAPAGFGKTTLVSEWVASCGRPAAWLSLDEADGDPARFLAYLVAALQTLDASQAAREGVAPKIGAGALQALQALEPPPPETVLTALLNEIVAFPEDFILVLDDYQLVYSRPVDQALTFLIEHLPPQMHLVVATREDPQLPLPRLRARGQLNELRAADLRFTPAEAAAFLNRVMGLDLSTEDIAALETRTEGWIAGLQMAALSMQRHQDVTGFVQSFSGGHHFVLDYLLEEVLQQQPESVQMFLLHTSILDRMCGPLCDAVLLDPAAPGQATLEYLERANLFIVPLDNERRWYRYHHLFADLLRQRLPGSMASSTGEVENHVNELHVRASQWYEDNRLDLEAFHHATAANDVERAERLIEGKGMPLHFRGVVVPVLNWLASLPPTVLDARPSLWTAYASVLLVTGQTTAAEQKLQAAEAALQGAEPDDRTQDLVGRIAAIRATVAAYQNQWETIIDQSRRALAYLHPHNLAFRTSTTWKLGYACHLQGERAAARQAYTEVISIGKVSGNTIFTIAATIGLGGLQEAENQLYVASQTYHRALQLFGDQPLPVAGVAHLGLARICYQWNDLEAAGQHGQQSLHLARLIENADRCVAGEVFLARLKLAQGNVAGAMTVLANADRSVRQHNFVYRVAEVAAAQVLTLLHQGKLEAAARLAETHKLPLSRARVHLAQGDPSAALVVLGPLRQQMEARGWEDERLKVMVLQALAHNAHGEKEKAVQLLGDALALAEPGGLIRIFVDEGLPMAHLLCEATGRGIVPVYTGRLLAAFEAEKQRNKGESPRPTSPASQPLVEPLSERELEILQLVAEGLSNREIGERLFLALNTVKTHNRNIFGKLAVQRRTEAVARARELGLL